MNETIRMLGISLSVKGTRILEDLIEGVRQVKDLSTNEVDDVLDAWQTRKFVPVKKISEAIDSRPEHLEGESTEEYDRRHIEEIVRIAKGL